MEQKKFVKVGLSTDNFRAYVGMIEDEVEEFLKHDSAFGVYQSNDINEWGKFDAMDILSQITILTASRTLQGKEVRSGLDKSFSELYSDLDGGFKPINFLFPHLPLESYRKRDKAQTRMSNFYVDILQKRKNGNNDVRYPFCLNSKLALPIEIILLQHDHDMMAALLNQKYRNGRPLPDHEIAHILIALLMAGQHTSSASGSWAMLHLAANPDVV
jgi:sterol 14-demethylase